MIWRMWRHNRWTELVTFCPWRGNIPGTWSPMIRCYLPKMEQSMYGNINKITCLIWFVLPIFLRMLLTIMLHNFVKKAVYSFPLMCFNLVMQQWPHLTHNQKRNEQILFTDNMILLVHYGTWIFYVRYQTIIQWQTQGHPLPSMQAQ